MEKYSVIHQGSEKIVYEIDNINPAFDLSKISMVLNDDGTYIARDIQGNEGQGSWELTGNNITISGITSEIKLMNNKLITIQYRELPNPDGTIDEKTIKTTFIKNSPLSISLINLVGYQEKNEIRLNWEITTEQNSQNFEILYSQTGKDFKKIGEVASKKGENKFIHRDFSIGSNYYQLKQIDSEGKSELSNIVHINVEDIEVRILPNPTENVFMITGLGGKSELPKVEIMDSFGKILLEGKSDSFNISDLPAGMYVVKIMINNEVYTEKLVKRNS